MSSSGTFDWNTVFNAILAFIAILGFILSLYYSRQSLKQAKDLNSKTIAVETFNLKHDNLMKCIGFFNNIIGQKREDISNDDFNNFRKSSSIVVMLFKDTVKCMEVFNQFMSYYIDNESLPDYTSQYKKSLEEYACKPNDDLSAFCFYANNELKELLQQFYMSRFLIN